MKTKDQYLDKVEPCPITGCWHWMGYLNKRTGYGHLKWHKAAAMAHRVSYELFVDLIPSDLQIDHLCRNRACVNPDHLEAVTSKENTLRGTGPTAINAKLTCCAKCGGDFSLERSGTTYKRRCRNCANTARRARTRAKRASRSTNRRSSS